MSITIGRRPVTPRASTSASAGPSVPLSLEEAQKAGISLEEYILNLDPSALSGAEPSATPASVKGKGKAVDGPLAEYLIASPPPPAASTVTNGPRTSISNTSRTPSAPSTPHPPASPFTDVDLGPLRAVSRQHARLYFDFDAGAWTIEVLGRNGIVIEGKWRGKGQKVVLTKKTRIQIAERIFHFVLPTIDVVTVEPSVAVEAISGPAQSEKQAVGTSKGKAKASAAGTNTDLGTTTTRPMVPEGLVSVEPGPERATSSASTKSNGLELLTESASADSAPVSASLPPPPLSSTPKPFTASSSRAVPAAPLSRPPPPGKMPVTSAASSRASAASARATLLPTPTAASNRPVRNTAKKPPPHAPKAASSAARASSLGLVSRAVSEEMDDASIEAARQRAAVIAQLLSGDAGAAASSKNSLVRAAAKAKRAGKGKAPMRMAGKGPGKGKGLMPPPRRPSDLGWSDDEDDDLFASSAEDDSHDDDEETSPMDVEVVAAGQGGGKAVVQRSASASSASASPAPPQPVPSKAPRKAGKMPAKQPRRRRDVPVSAQPVATASPAPSTTEASPRASSPTLPSTLPALPNLSPSPAVDSPVSLPALNLLPPLPALKPSPSPAVAAAPLPPTSSAAPTTSNSQPTPSPAPVPASAKKAKPSKKGKTEGTSAPAEAANPEASSAAAKSNAATSASGQSDAAAPAKPRPSPYAPAPLPPGVPPPDAAPADNRTAKPPYTYASLIAQAINSSPAKKLTLHEIYDWVTDKWPYFLGNQKGWQNSIRHNLTPARGFLKIVREKDDAGKGSFWEIDPTQMSNFDGHHYRKKPDGPTGGTASNKAKADAAAKAAAAATAQITAAASQAPPTSATASTSKSDAKPSAPRASAPSNAPLSKPLPVIVAPIPDSYVRPSTPSDGSQPTDELTAALLADPPIVLHESKLVLNPTIFSSLSDAELGELQKQPASAALQTLQAKVVQHFKDKMRNKSVQKLSECARTTSRVASADTLAPLSQLPPPKRPRLPRIASHQQRPLPKPRPHLSLRFHLFQPKRRLPRRPSSPKRRELVSPPSRLPGLLQPRRRRRRRKPPRPRRLASAGANRTSTSRRLHPPSPRRSRRRRSSDFATPEVRRFPATLFLAQLSVCGLLRDSGLRRPFGARADAESETGDPSCSIRSRTRTRVGSQSMSIRGRYIFLAFFSPAVLLSLLVARGGSESFGCVESRRSLGCRRTVLAYECSASLLHERVHPSRAKRAIPGLPGGRRERDASSPPQPLPKLQRPARSLVLQDARMAGSAAPFSSLAVLQNAHAPQQQQPAGAPTSSALAGPSSNTATAGQPEKKRRRRTAEDGKRYACDFEGCGKGAPPSLLVDPWPKKARAGVAHRARTLQRSRGQTT